MNLTTRGDLNGCRPAANRSRPSLFIAGTESSGAASCTTSATFAKRRKSHNDPYPLDGARKFDPDGTTVTSRTAVAA
ncbi:hypothetical protein, partial [Acidocella aminolytica]|uniref:hypothetical protein n=1 Tax=Acidocella aminolytica TaxID=33998 RepID=UPI0022322C0D